MKEMKGKHHLSGKTILGYGDKNFTNHYNCHTMNECKGKNVGEKDILKVEHLTQGPLDFVLKEFSKGKLKIQKKEYKVNPSVSVGNAGTFENQEKVSLADIQNRKAEQSKNPIKETESIPVKAIDDMTKKELTIIAKSKGWAGKIKNLTRDKAAKTLKKLFNPNKN